MKEKRSIEITAFRDPSGNPTCAVDPTAEGTCTFYRTSHFGCFEGCALAAGEHILRRGPDGMGYMIPVDNCPVWSVK